MAHELSIINGTAELAYLVTEGPCWHELGQAVSVDATRNEWLQACNIANWQFERRKALMMVDGAIHAVPNVCHIARDDNHKVVATVSDQFNIHQPQEAAAWMFDAVEQLGFEMSTMGVLFDGKKFWCQANIKQSVNIGGIDRVDGKLHICIANTGQHNSTIGYSTTRIVCNNTLRAATGTGTSLVKVNHKQKFDAARVSEELGLFDLADWQKAAERLAKHHITDDAAQEYLLKVFKLYEETEDTTAEELEATTAKALEHRAVKQCFELFNGAGKGSELATARGTAWGLVNSVTEYIDHHRNTRTWDARFDASQFGSFADVKDRAWDEALMML